MNDKNSFQARRTQRGFTLIEVMVALVIAALALTALTRGLGQYVFQQSQLQERVIATWVAENRLLELQRLPGAQMENRAQETALSQDWQTEFTTSDTLIDGIQKVEVAVTAPAEKQPTVRLYSILGGG
ncbi:type II secretion system minor pseudopilin GspI [Hydrogenovibrio thermophilus]|jgi:general secretion pathway protein I|uniref:Type II secretion system protein I n=1 Tax=Hydrogenovibrio thermophilus TaxID=265883 RepID=A0A451G549_9GAMM|nr:type II secretion system minor pseudopilin GspI [Hydrogenovibrio thermophilus]QAB14623.1 type II secretion system protein GspI [Hydrogenovibrio thermophilus]